TIVLSNSGSQATLHVFQPDGSERAGWPVTVPNNSQYPQTFLAVADMNRDGHEEIVFSHETALYLYKSDGTLFSNAWPLMTGVLGYGSVVIGDIDGDGFPEIVTTRDEVVNGYYDAKLLAIRRDGTIARSWQLTGRNGFDQYAYPLPTIGDFDQDGITDIAVSYEVTGPNAGVPGVVTILSTGAPFDPLGNDWPLLLHDARNTGVRARRFLSSTNVVLNISGGTSPSIYGQSITLQAIVSSQTGNPVGTVD